MKNMLKYLSYFTFGCILILSFGFIYRTAERYRKEIALSDERALKVNVEAGYGNLKIGRGSSNQILQADINANLKSGISEYIDYTSRDETGYLNINTTDMINKTEGSKNHSMHISGFEDSDWNMKFTDKIPIAFDIELGMGKGDLNLSGIQVNDLSLSTGASSVILQFDEQNKSSIENLNIETGLSKFKGYGLCYANFDNMKFEGGVGSYILDFGGQLDKEVNVDIKVGLGSATISIPEETGAKVYYEKSWIASINLPKDFSEQEDNNYFSSNYYNTTGRINFHIEAGLGSVTIKHK